MTIIPAIDLLDGACVRLLKGNYDKATVYNSDPAATAAELCSLGCSRLHIVDLDAARGKGKNNRKVIKEIRKAVPGITIETGGGIRSEQDVEELLETGIDRLILGTVFAKNPSTAAEWTKKYGSCFIAGIDALNGKVKISGWEKGSSMSDIELARHASGSGIISIIYTNIDKDGTLSGPDVTNSLKIAEVSGLPVIVSGGIRGEKDFSMLAELNNSRITGVITGKALYENKFDLETMIQKYNSETEGVLW